MKKFFLFLFIIAAMWQVCFADLPDTVWTRDLWQLGSQINQVQFTPDGHGIAVAIGGGVYVFDIKTGQIVKQFNKYMFICSSFDFTEDGLKLITSSYETDYKRKIIVWNYLNEDTIRIFNNIDLHPIRALNNNTIFGIWNLPVWSLDSSKVCLYDINIGKIIINNLLTGQNDFIDAKGLSISKRMNLFAIITGNVFNKIQNIILGNLTKLEYSFTLGSHSSQINDLSFSSDGRYLASASSDGIIKVWDVDQKKLYKQFIHDSIEKDVKTVRFSPDSKYIISGISIWNKWNTKIWEINTDKLVHKYEYGLLSGLDVTNDGNYIVGGAGSLLYLLKAVWKPTGIETYMEKKINSLIPNPSGTDINLPIIDGKIPSRITITDILGKLILSDDMLKITSLEMKVDIGLLLPGAYFVTITYPDKTITYKFLKMR